MSGTAGPAADAAMLTLARESRGMTQLDLASVMTALAHGDRISQGYVSKAEAGRLAVGGTRLDLYAQALHYPVHALCIEPNATGIGIGLVHHRKKAALGAQPLRRIHAELALARLQVRRLVSSKADIIHSLRIVLAASEGDSRSVTPMRSKL